MPQILSKALAGLRWLESAILVLLLSGMIGVAAAQVLMRNLFDGGLYWGDALVRVMVLWVAMIGAMVASRNDQHIRIDLAGRFLPEGAKIWVSRGVNLFTCIVLGLFAWAGYQFVYFEYLDGTIAFA